MLTAIYVLLILLIIFDLIVIYIFISKDEPKPYRKKKKRGLPAIPVSTGVDDIMDSYAEVEKPKREICNNSLYRYCNPPMAISKDDLNLWYDNPPDLFHIDEGEIPEGLVPEEWYSRAIDIIGGMSQEDIDTAQAYHKQNNPLNLLFWDNFDGSDVPPDTHESHK